MPSACAPSRSPCSRNTLRPRVGKCSTVSIPTCSWTSRQAAQALIRIFAIGESATSIAVAPASRNVWAAATSWAALKDRGGSISTVITSARASIAAWSAVGATAARAGTSAAGAGGGKVTVALGPRWWSSAAIAAVWAGPVPQQPPTIVTPSSSSARTTSATYSGVAG